MAVTRKTTGPRALRRRQRRNRALFIKHPSQEIAQLWILRLLVEFEGWRNLYSHAPIDEGDILSPLGLDTLVEEWGVESCEYNPPIARKLLPHLQELLNENQELEPLLDSTLEENLDGLAEQVGLSDVEKTLLAFAVIHQTYKPLSECTDSFSDLRADQVLVLLAVALDFTEAEVRKALSPDRLLQSSGLLILHRNLGPDSLRDKLELLTGLAERLMEPQSDAMDLLRGFFHEAPVSGLDCDDFAFMGEDVELLQQYLEPAVNKGFLGINILFYGVPGTGKTELARALAEALGFQLIEVAFDGHGETPLSGRQRLSAYQLCQSVLSSANDTLVLFDEVEDAFTLDFPFGGSSFGEGSKARINHMLENNPVPAIWICNSIDDIDEAYLRRFDHKVKFDTPPRRVRHTILRDQLEGLNVSDRWINQVAAHPAIAPAFVTRAAKVVTIAGTSGRKKTERQLERLLSSSLEAMGREAELINKTVSDLSYRLDVLNPDRDLTRLIEGIRQRGRGRFCLYGAPGTGKSEFARHTADATNRPLIVKRASDLLSKWVGETEKSIAAMFQEAEDNDAILLLDEADSFLRDRRGAHNSWEVTQVNELLTRMERYQGVFICSTNLMDDLDEASVRRFDMKIRFDWMKPNQAWTLFRQVIKDHQGRMPAKNSPWCDRLRQLDQLAPGDFATVVRRSSIMGDDLTPERLYTGLAEEAGFKKNRNGKSIGFTATL